MQRCDKCPSQFKWTEIYKSLWGLYGSRPIQCNKCGTKYKIVFSSGVLVSFLLVVPMVIFDLFVSKVPTFSTIMINIVFIVFISLFIPFLVRYIPD